MYVGPTKITSEKLNELLFRIYIVTAENNEHIFRIFGLSRTKLKLLVSGNKIFLAMGVL